MLVVVFSVLILLNFVGSFLFKRFDLTAEKRYTLSESTKKQIYSYQPKNINEGKVRGNSFGKNQNRKSCN